jgi:anthranilate synthase component I
MLYKTSFDEYQQLSDKGRVVVAKEIYGDQLTPVRVFQALAKHSDDIVLLDSSDHPTAEQACIYIGMDPIASFSSTGSLIKTEESGQKNCSQGDAYDALRDFYHRNKCQSVHQLAKFSGGMIGFMSYDAVRLFEDVPDQHENEDQVPDLLFKCYGTHLVFDKRTGKVLVARVVDVTDQPKKASYQDVMQGIDDIIENVMAATLPMPSKKDSASIAHPIEPDIDDEGYRQMVSKAKAYVEQGDAFQIVLSRRFEVKYQADDFDLYRALRVLNPSPYQFYIRTPDYTIVGSSPERLVSLQAGIVETMPIAGTRPRGKDAETDLQLERELLADQKEQSEHTMLVDLGRNDVGRIAEPGTVKVVEKAKIHKYSRVMHIVSRVQGTLRKGYDCFDVLKSCFPAGTLTGAPKVRAMEIIDALETSRRGIYGGAIIAFDNQGQMDGCITIRTAFVKDGVVSVRAGAGIVLDSDPQKEADETRHKVQAVIDAVELASKAIL